MRILFVCSRNRLRSPTAEAVFAGHDGLETASAGLAPDADCPLEAEQIGWADLIVVMERVHKTRINQRFAQALCGKKLVCLDIPDRYTFMQPELLALLERKMAPHLQA